MAGKMTPMMVQYLEIKKNYKNCILFYRLGDFYEMFFEDAIIASAELDLTLTGKDCGMDERAPMCGVPFHSADSYIAKLVANGRKVAICEQVEDPKKAKGIVKRDVIRVVTPGTLLDTSVLDEGKNNFLMCIFADEKGYGTAYCDITTGDLFVSEFKIDDENSILDAIEMYQPAEIIVNQRAENIFSKHILNIFNKRVTKYKEYMFEYPYCDMMLCNHFHVLNLMGYGLDKSKHSVCAAGALLTYLSESQKGKSGLILGIRKYSPSDYMILDINSRRNLELTENINEKTKKGSLLWVMDKTKTAMGARTLRSWIEQPLVDPYEINKRLDAVEENKNNVFARDDIRQALGGVYDIERLMSKVTYATANARDLIALRDSFEKLPSVKNVISQFNTEYYAEILEDFDELQDIFELINSAINDDPPFSLREGGFIKEGYNAEIDQLRLAKTEGTKWLAELEAKEKEATGIKKLKIGFNRVFGYYIEVTNSFKNLVPQTYIRKQTLANAERYITPELKEIEDKILGADEKLVSLEYDLFCQLRDNIAAKSERIKQTAMCLAKTDVLQSLGEVAEQNHYIKPKITTNGIIKITDGRHPVVEQLNENEFIPNDTYLDMDKETVAIITGPNMAGKSTYMRQVALIVLMAQVGSFVPASSAMIGITDRIFTRVGASDNLATGQSTFMVEMSEVANILNNATRNSLLILDEIGRGTSTYDGLSIAWAVMEYISKKIGARALFATHYHEITKLASDLKNVTNYCVKVKEDGEDIIFLRKIIEGAADKSYGVHVARLAGVPASVVKRADKILANLGKNEKEIEPVDYDYYQNFEYQSNVDSVISKLQAVDINNITPMQSMQLLTELKDIVGNNKWVVED